MVGTNLNIVTSGGVGRGLVCVLSCCLCSLCKSLPAVAGVGMSFAYSFLFSWCPYVFDCVWKWVRMVVGSVLLSVFGLMCLCFFLVCLYDVRV